MSWLDTTIERAGAPVEVDVSSLGLADGGEPVLTLQAQPLTVGEYMALKSSPELSKLSGEDRVEALGLRMAYEMLAKCDSSLSWAKWKQLPLGLLSSISAAVVEAVGSPAGGGALGEA